MIRLSKRHPNETRNISFETGVNCHAEGSCLVSFGRTKIICTATHEFKVPRFLKDKNQGWLTAEYSMLPRSTHTRIARESSLGKKSGRTQEIQRLIGRSLRAALDLNKLGENQITIDCDVIQADGGTRTAAISGGYVALAICVNKLLKENILKSNPIIANIAAISCGISQGEILVDLDYIEDSNIDIDANFVFNSNDEIVEIQASSERNTFAKDMLNQMYDLSYDACSEIFTLQNDAVEKASQFKNP